MLKIFALNLMVLPPPSENVKNSQCVLSKILNSDPCHKGSVG
jgi:hypothetical protein